MACDRASRVGLKAKPSSSDLLGIRRAWKAGRRIGTRPRSWFGGAGRRMTVAGGLIHGKAPPDRVLIIASMSRQTDKISSAANQGSRERDMVAIVAALARELHPQRSRLCR